MKNYIGYIRVSNAEHDTSIPAQKEKLLSYARTKGFNLIKIYEERKSAFRANNRKVFNQMIGHLRKEEIDGVVFHKIDRSSRNPMEFATLESFFDTKDIKIIEGEFDSNSATGRLSFRMFCSLAIFYSENLSEEVTLKMKERLKLGYMPSSCAFGYRKGIKGKDPDFKMKYPNKDAQIVQKIFTNYATGAYSYLSLAKEISQQGVKMTKSKIERILNNPFYIGKLHWKSDKTGEITVYEGNHEPIISMEQWNAIQKIMGKRTTTRGKISRSPYSLFMKCECNQYLVHSTSHNGRTKRQYQYLTCCKCRCN